MTERLTTRQRNKLTTMRHVQTEATTLFEQHGFDNVTVEAIAEATGTSASTIYRHFGTKEDIILWDPFEDELVRCFEEVIADTDSTTEAFFQAFLITWAERDDTNVVLRHIRLTHSNASLLGASAKQDRDNRHGLAQLFAAAHGRRSVTMADDTAAALCLTVIDIAMDYWHRSDGKTPMPEIISEITSHISNASTG